MRFLVWNGNRNRGMEARCPWTGFVLEVLNQIVTAVFIRELLAVRRTITSGIQAGRTTQRIYFQTRVIGKGDQSAGLGEGNCFFGRVFSIGESIFDYIEIELDLGRRDKLNPYIF